MKTIQIPKGYGLGDTFLYTHEPEFVPFSNLLEIISHFLIDKKLGNNTFECLEVHKYEVRYYPWSELYRTYLPVAKSKFIGILDE